MNFPISMLRHLKYSVIENNIIAFLYIVFFRELNIITDQKMKGMFKSLKAGTFLTRKGTYHSKINNKWYNDESMLEILEDIMLQMNNNVALTIDLETMIKYVGLYHNKNWNWCIDSIFFTIIKPSVENKCYSSYFDYNDNNGYFDYSGERFKVYGLEIYGIDRLGYDNYYPDGYCCEDCSGDYEEYKKSQYYYQISSDRNNKVKEVVTNYLNDKKRKGTMSLINF